MTTLIEQTAFRGGTIWSGGSLGGLIYSGKIKGVEPMLMYGPKAWLDRNKYVSMPLGKWPVETEMPPVAITKVAGHIGTKSIRERSCDFSSTSCN
jgi:hypothetical protein